MYKIFYLTISILFLITIPISSENKVCPKGVAERQAFQINFNQITNKKMEKLIPMAPSGWTTKIHHNDPVNMCGNIKGALTNYYKVEWTNISKLKGVNKNKLNEYDSFHTNPEIVELKRKLKEAARNRNQQEMKRISKILKQKNNEFNINKFKTHTDDTSATIEIAINSYLEVTDGVKLHIKGLDHAFRNPEQIKDKSKTLLLFGKWNFKNKRARLESANISDKIYNVRISIIAHPDRADEIIKNISISKVKRLLL